MPEASSSSSTQSDSPQNLSTPATLSQKQVSRPTASQNTGSHPTEPQISELSPQPLTPKEPVLQSSIPRASPSSTISTTQVTGVPQNIPAPVSIPPASGITANPLPSIGEPGTDDTNNVALLATAFGIHQLLSQVSASSPVAQVPSVPASKVTQVSSVSTSEVQLSSMPTSKNPNVVEQTQLTLSPTQLSIDPSQVTVGLTRSLPESPVISAEVVVTQPPPSALPQPTMITADAVAVDVMPNVRYRARGSGTTVSEKPSRRSLIDGAPDIIMELHTTPKVPLPQDLNDDDIQEVVVDLSDYISMAGNSDEESHVSSSQKTSDECRDLLPPSPPPSSQWRNSSLGKSQSTLTRTHAQLDVDEGDLPTWMLKKSQWKYVASTAGGPAWEKLLKVYMEQERRLEFTDMVSYLICIFPPMPLNYSQGASLTSEHRPSKIKEYFQYAHQPSRGNTLMVPGFGVEVANWWKAIQPEWRHSEEEPPLGPTTWSFILSGGSKGTFLIVMCLAWWDHAHARYREEENARRIKAEAAGVIANFDDFPPNHDTEWLKIVEDVAFVMEMARNCDIPTRGQPSPSRRTKRKRDPEPTTPQKRTATRTTLKTRSRT